MQAYVQDQDIVARAGLAADPLYGLAMKIGLVKAALELREWVLGSGGVLSAERFLFQTAGEVHFMRTKGDLHALDPTCTFARYRCYVRQSVGWMVTI